MVRHIVFWNLSDFAEGADKTTNGNIIKTSLESLVGKIDGIIELQVNFNYNEHGYDLCLYSVFESDEVLKNYQTHPLHIEAGQFVKKVTTQRVVTDCIIK